MDRWLPYLYRMSPGSNLCPRVLTCPVSPFSTWRLGLCRGRGRHLAIVMRKKTKQFLCLSVSAFITTRNARDVLKGSCPQQPTLQCSEALSGSAFHETVCSSFFVLSNCLKNSIKLLFIKKGKQLSMPITIYVLCL